MPKVASKLSLSHSPTAWMQPRTWMTLSNSRRWKQIEKKYHCFNLDGALGRRCYFLCLLLSASQRSAMTNIWELIYWIWYFLGFSWQKKQSLKFTGHTAALCRDIPHNHPWGPQKQLLSYHQALNHNSGPAFPGTYPVERSLLSEMSHQSLQRLHRWARSHSASLCRDARVKK